MMYLDDSPASNLNLFRAVKIMYMLYLAFIRDGTK